MYFNGAETYKAGAKAENSHIDVQNLKTVLSLYYSCQRLTQKILVLINLGGGGYNPRNPPPAYGPAGRVTSRAVHRRPASRRRLSRRTTAGRTGNAE